MDSCLPVFHLIDSQRSIPYAIKQVEDLLGISCAFEQAVQVSSTNNALVSNPVCFMLLTIYLGLMHLSCGFYPFVVEYFINQQYTLIDSQRSIPYAIMMIF